MFVEKIRSVVVPPEHIMVSFDVKSLFTNVPVELVIECVRSKWEILAKNTPIPEALFIKILTFILKTSYFVFMGKMYIQNQGLPMGGPLSPIAADLIMDSALKTITDRLDYPLICLTKYVDDIFCLIPRDKIETTLEIFNGFHPSLQFTVEVENNGGLPYLDTFVLRGATTLDSVWYQKPTSSPRMLNYVSKHPLQLKVATAVGFIQRVSKLTTTNRENMRISIYTQLRINNYPPYLINSLMQRHLRANTVNESIPKPTQEDIQYAAIEYIPCMSEKIRHLLSRSLPNVSCSMKPSNSASRYYSKLKDKIPKLKRSNVVYKIDCECGKGYIGKTEQRLERRLQQHKTSLQKEKEETALVTHARAEQHVFDFDNTTILDHAEHHNKLITLEMIQIQIHRNNAVNKHSDTAELGTSYAAIIQTLQRKAQERNRRSIEIERGASADRQNKQIDQSSTGDG